MNSNPGQAARLELHALGLADALLAGPFPSVFRGEGTETAGVRRYVAGDDVRRLDWKVTARTGRPHVREREEEREIPLLLVVDRSASLHGTASGGPGGAALDAASALAAAASRQGRRLSLVQVADGVPERVPEAAGREHLRRVLERLAEPWAPDAGTDLAPALERAAAHASGRTLVAVVSDFRIPGAERARVAGALARLARRHDLLAVRVRTPGPPRAEGLGRVWLRDPESGERRLIGAGAADAGLLRAEEVWEAWWAATVSGCGLTPVDVDPGAPAVPQLVAGLALRRRRGA